MSITQVQLWYNRFKKDREDFNDDARRGRPITPTIDEIIEIVKEMILDNRRITIREVADDGWHIARFRHETYDSEDCFKIAEFRSKNNVA